MDEPISMDTLIMALTFIASVLALWWRISAIRSSHESQIEHRIAKEKDFEHRIREIEKHGSGTAMRKVEEMETKVRNLSDQVHEIDISTEARIDKLRYKTDETFKSVFKQLEKIEKSTACLPQIKIDLGIIKEKLKV